MIRELKIGEKYDAKAEYIWVRTTDEVFEEVDSSELDGYDMDLFFEKGIYVGSDNENIGVGAYASYR
jgi:hypothetical protein